MLHETRSCKKCKQEQGYDQFYLKGQICFTCQKKRNQGFSRLKELVPVRRICLQCDKPFLSPSNRRCDECHGSCLDLVYGDSSLFVSC
jgi:hypothetical protein